MRETGRSGCPINLALEVLGDRWSLLILRDMIFAGKRTFNQLLDSDEGIATNVLRDRLNSLVERGLLTKSDDPERKGRTRYALTERAITLVPVLVHLGHWGERWLSADPDLRRMNRRLFTGGPVLWERSWTSCARDGRSGIGRGARIPSQQAEEPKRIDRSWGRGDDRRSQLVLPPKT